MYIVINRKNIWLKPIQRVIISNYWQLRGSSLTLLRFPTNPTRNESISIKNSNIQNNHSFISLFIFKVLQQLRNHLWNINPFHEENEDFKFGKSLIFQ